MSDSLAAAARIREISATSAQNQNFMNMATDSMERISASAGESMGVIRRLGEESKEIVRIIQTISHWNTIPPVESCPLTCLIEQKADSTFSEKETIDES